MNRGRRNDGRRTNSRTSSNATSRGREGTQGDAFHGPSETSPGAPRTPGLRHERRHSQAPQVVGQHSQTAGADPYQMSAMGNALPEYNQLGSQAFGTSTMPNPSQPVIMSPPAGMIYQMPQGFSYTATPPYGSPPPVFSAYGQAQFMPGYPIPASNAHPSYTMYSQSQHARESIPQVSQFPHPAAPYPVFHISVDPTRQVNMPTASYVTTGRNEGVDYAQMHAQQSGLGRTDQRSRAYNSIVNQTADAVFGPPRKPRQSGYAIWVGNLPPTATILPLKDHFSQGFAREIESVFLISKSNCAFVNYRTEDACNRAIKRFHDSRFDGVRLVCRLRKTSVTGAIPPAVLAVTDTTDSESSSPDKQQPESGEELPSAEILVDGEADAVLDKITRTIENPKVRYFILKSLTLHDLKQSVRNKVWATQVHNENILNEAFKTSENVFLIFSVNKSGEYFGYARMESAIEVDAIEVLGPIKRADVVASNQQHRMMSAPATKQAPRGKVTDDPFRGTIFWEAEYTDDEEVEEATDKEASALPTWGKPFKIAWKSKTSVPFWRTKGIRNPWNANREVKIARDGTELESSVGERLIRLFHPIDV